MSVLYVLIACSLLLALLFLGAFVWVMRSGQYDDRFTPAVRVLFDNNNTLPKRDDKGMAE